MRPILAGIETEYGLQIEGRGATEQMEDAAALVRSYPNERLPLWDYRYETPRNDLRGFSVQRLAVDPVDARFDEGVSRARDDMLRADSVLPNGARLYNDHGHPEYATPECRTLRELALHDKAGELAVLRAAQAYEKEIGRKVRLFKNNTDFHGASYGTHESYLAPRELGFERLFACVTPILVARQVLCGAGKVGAEAGPRCRFQLSQRAEFLVESASVDTLYRRPVFNTRDEPHADPAKWIRLHVISGDANMIESATRRKVGLVKLALALEEACEAPRWRIAHPAHAMSLVSKDESGCFRIPLEGGSWTTAREVLESYFAAAEKRLGLGEARSAGSLEEELWEVICECRELLDALSENSERFARSVDWAAKRRMLERFMEAEGTDWDDPRLQAFDLEYHNLNKEEGLFEALAVTGAVEPPPASEAVERCLRSGPVGSRALARGIAVSRFAKSVRAVSWRSLVFEMHGDVIEVPIDPDREYTAELNDVEDVQSFIRRLKEFHEHSS